MLSYAAKQQQTRTWTPLKKKGLHPQHRPVESDGRKIQTFKKSMKLQNKEIHTRFHHKALLIKKDSFVENPEIVPKSSASRSLEKQSWWGIRLWL